MEARSDIYLIIKKGQWGMSPIIVTYFGFVVAALILIWGVAVLSRRYSGRRKADTNAPNTWVPLRPSVPARPDIMRDPIVSPDDDQDETANSDLHTRAKQNGHYSESKKPL